MVKQVRAAEARVPVGSKRAVHAARMKIKKARAILTLLEHAKTQDLDKDRRRLRKAARALAGLRDLEVAVATYDGLRSATPSLVADGKKSRVRRLLVHARDHTHGRRRRDTCLREATAFLHKVQRSADSWDIPTLASADLARLLATSYGAARRDFMAATQSPRGMAMHEWRKSVKTLWYQLQLVGGDAPDERHRIELLTELQKCLGQHQDLEMLQSALADEEPRSNARTTTEINAVTAAARSQQARLRATAFDVGQHVFSATPSAFARDLRRALSKTDQPSPAPRDSRSAVA
jgi:CHAD domain-containing protein